MSESAQLDPNRDQERLITLHREFSLIEARR
jgi:hypothetical protein